MAPGDKDLAPARSTPGRRRAVNDSSPPRNDSRQRVAEVKNELLPRRRRHTRCSPAWAMRERSRHAVAEEARARETWEREGCAPPGSSVGEGHPARKHEARGSARRPRVLVIAEMANPDWVSVPLVGWSHWHALSKRVEGHLVTHVRNRENILATGLDPSRLTTLDTATVEDPVVRVVSALRGKGGGGWTTFTALGSISYYYFEHVLWRELGARIRAGEWDLVHRLTPLTPTTPSLIARACERYGVPFVLGPLNGGVPWPKGFARARIAENEWLTYVRGAYKMLPGYRATRRSAAAIIAGSLDTRDQIAPPYRDKTVYIPENAVDPMRFGQAKRNKRKRSVSQPLRVAFVGRLTLYKGPDMLIEAAAPLVRAGKIELEIIGDGPQRDPLRELARREGLPGSLFAGWVSHDALPERLGRADVLAFPSIREFGGGVVLEAMAMGVVPIVVGYGGPAELVTTDSGIALPMGSRSAIVASLRETLERLVADPSSIGPMGERARERVLRSFTWDAKASQMVEVYRWVLGQRDKPDFGMPLAG